MTLIPTGAPISAAAAAETVDDQVARLGIVAVAATRYEYGGYRYTNASDAIAAATRAAK